MSSPLVEMRGIERTYVMGDNLVHALRGVDLTIDAGSSIAIMGTSGSGKSTLMNIMGCLDQPTKGSYLLNGQDVARLSKAAARRRARPDDRVRVPELQPAVAHERARERRDAADVPGRRRPRAAQARDARARARRPRRIASDHHPSQLSGGQQQRVAIARALVTDAPVIMADEPTGNLDTRTSYEVMAILQGLVDQGKTVILVTHETDIAAYASRVITLRDGLIIDDKAQTPIKAEVAA